MVTKRGGDGKDYPASAFLYVPDRSKASTWKIRVKAYEGGSLKVTNRQVGLAAAAFSPGGFRGKKVQLPPEAMASVKRKLRGLYRKLGVATENIPKYLREWIGWKKGDVIYEGVMREDYSSTVFDDVETRDGKVRFDKEKGIMRNLAFLGLESANRRRYVRDVVKGAVRRGVYEGLPCYLDHSDKKTGRSVRELAGRWSNTWFDEENGVARGDLKTLAQHRDVLFDVAENAPDLAAPSHVIYGKSVKEKDANGEWIEKVTQIAKGKSVDIVCDAATVKNMKEGLTMKTIDEITLEDLKTSRPELYEEILEEGRVDIEEEKPSEKNVDFKALYEAEKGKRETLENVTRVKETEELVKGKLSENLDYLPETVHPRIFKMIEGRIMTEEEVDAFITENVEHAKALGVKPKETEEKKVSESKIPVDEKKETDKKSKRELLTESLLAMGGDKLPDKSKE